MKLEERFELSAPPERVWEVLNDIEAIAPFVPGFNLTDAEGDTFRGTMKVKLGAMTVEYEAQIAIAERDDAGRRVRMDVSGREPRGGGKMHAEVTSRLEPTGTGTAVTLDTDLELAGRVAQMGRGMIADVSAKLIGDFVRSLETNVLAPTANGTPAAAQTQAAGAAVDLTSAAGAAAAKRIVPMVIGAIVVVVLVRRLTGSR
jgi:carbon monoxide dehydrogenase subunit G